MHLSTILNIFLLISSTYCNLEKIQIPLLDNLFNKKDFLLTSAVQMPSSMPTSIPTWITTNYPSSTPTLIPTWITTNYPSSIPTSIPTRITTNYPSSIPTSIPTRITTNYPSSIPTSIPTWITTNYPSSIPTLKYSNSPTQNTNTSQLLSFELILYFIHYILPELDASSKQVIILSTSKTMNISSSYITIHNNNKNNKIKILDYNVNIKLDVNIPIQKSDPIQLYNNIITQFKSSYDSGIFRKNLLDISDYYNNPYFLNINITNITIGSPVIININQTLHPTMRPTISPTFTKYLYINNVFTTSDEMLIVIIFSALGGFLTIYAFIMYLFYYYKYKYKGLIKNESINILNEGIPMYPIIENDINIIVVDEMYEI